MHSCCWGPGHFIVVPVLLESIQRNEIQGGTGTWFWTNSCWQQCIWYTPAVFVCLHGLCCAEEPVAGAEASYTDAQQDAQPQRCSPTCKCCLPMLTSSDTWVPESYVWNNVLSVLCQQKGWLTRGWTPLAVTHHVQRARRETCQTSKKMLPECYFFFNGSSTKLLKRESSLCSPCSSPPCWLTLSWRHPLGV